MYRLAIVENDLIYLINPNILNWTEILGKVLKIHLD